MHLIEDSRAVVSQCKNDMLRVIKIRKEKQSDVIGIIVGLDDERRVIISELKPGSLAEKNGQMKAGDRIKWINENNVEELGAEKTQEILDKIKLRLHMVISSCHEMKSTAKDKKETTLEEAQLIPNVFESEEPLMFEVTYLCA